MMRKMVSSEWRYDKKFRIASDAIMMADSTEGLQVPIHRIVKTSKYYGMSFNREKNKSYGLIKTRISRQTVRFLGSPTKFHVLVRNRSTLQGYVFE